MFIILTLIEKLYLKEKRMFSECYWQNYAKLRNTRSQSCTDNTTLILISHSACCRTSIIVISFSNQLKKIFFYCFAWPICPSIPYI